MSQPTPATVRLGSQPRSLVEVLEQVRQRYQFAVIGYMVMPEHFRVLISEPEVANPSVVIQALKLAFVRRLFPRRRNGGQTDLFHDVPALHTWQRRLYDFVVWTPAKRQQKLNSMHENLVKRGWCWKLGSGSGTVFDIMLMAKQAWC